MCWKLVCRSKRVRDAAILPSRWSYIAQKQCKTHCVQLFIVTGVSGHTGGAPEDQNNFINHVKIQRKLTKNHCFAHNFNARQKTTPLSAQSSYPPLTCERSDGDPGERRVFISKWFPLWTKTRAQENRILHTCYRAHVPLRARLCSGSCSSNFL